MPQEFQIKFKKAYTDLYNLHPNQPEVFHFRYVNQNWFFKNHLNIVLKNIKKFHAKYYPNSNLEAALYGGLFHAAGLVYERNSASSIGHESRSIVYAREKLEELGYDLGFIDTVCECIAATESDYETNLPEAILVRNADAYSHFTSIHFFAKSNFMEKVEDFISWFSKKIDSTYKKLSIPDLSEDIAPIYKKYREMLEIYNCEQNTDLFSEVF